MSSFLDMALFIIYLVATTKAVAVAELELKFNQLASVAGLLSI
jgi:hypothetical protein